MKIVASNDFVDVEVTEESVNAAIFVVTEASKNEQLAKALKALLLSPPKLGAVVPGVLDLNRNQMLFKTVYPGIMALIHQAIESPGGQVERICRAAGLLSADIVESLRVPG